MSSRLLAVHCQGRSPSPGRSPRGRSRSPAACDRRIRVTIEHAFAFAAMLLARGYNQQEGTWCVCPGANGFLIVSVGAAVRYMNGAPSARVRVNAEVVREILSTYVCGIGVQSQTPMKTLAELCTWFGIEPAVNTKLSQDFYVIDSDSLCAVLRQMATERPDSIRYATNTRFRFHTKPFLPMCSVATQGLQWTVDRVQRGAVETYAIATVLREAAGLDPNPAPRENQAFICGPNWQLTPIQ